MPNQRIIQYQRINLDAFTHLVQINELLQEYAGYYLKLWAYQVSLSQLVLRIERGAAGNFHLQLGAVESIILPQLSWPLGGQIVERNAGQNEPRYAFVDQAVGVNILCSLVGLEENVEPVY